MKNKNQPAQIIRLIARIWGTISLVFLVYFFGAHLIDSLSGGGDPLGNFKSDSEMISFAFFPLSLIIGLAIAWKWEGLGGFITIGGIIGFQIMRPDLLFNLMIDGLAIPGLFYIVYWFLTRKLKNEIM
jgi:hypothetical protein